MQYLVAFLLSINLPFYSSVAPITETGIDTIALIQNDSIIDVPSLTLTQLARVQFEDSIVHLYNAMNLSDYNMSYKVFRYGMIGYNTMQQQGKINSKNILTIIDFTKPSTKKRFYTLDLSTLKVTYYTYVSHGKNTGENDAKSFSNIVHSNQSSLGFYSTAETYIGSKGYSLKLDGLEEGFNDNMRQRAVVIHEADYVSEYWIEKYGRLGRSHGCPALPKALSKEIIDTIKNQTLIFAYYNDQTYLQQSSYLNLDQVISNMQVTASAK